jgi:bifunctional DNase/RNase
MDVEVKIRALMMDPNTGTPIIILKEVESEAILPIWVRPYEANAIAEAIEKISPPRPMTHDLLRNLIIQVGGIVKRVIVTELRDSTYFAIIEIQTEESGLLSLDARPSDAIALALRSDSPIFVASEVIRISQNLRANAESDADNTALAEEEEWPDVIGETGDLPM